MTEMYMRDCIDLCQKCHDTCEETLFSHCLEMGGEHVEKEHVTLMADCIAICQAAADFMRRDSEFHSYICAACAKICQACADSCEAIGGTEMEHCADICYRCADSCREMGNMRAAA